MNIFDLNIEDFEKEVDKFLNNIIEDELLEELIENGLLIDVYDIEDKNGK